MSTARPVFLAVLLVAASTAGVSPSARAEALHLEPTAVDAGLLDGLRSGLLMQQETPAAASEPPARSFAHSDERDFFVAPSVATDFHDTTIGIFDVGVNWFVAESISVGIFGEVLTVSQDPENAWGGGGGGLVRWHFVREERFTLFAEVGCGLVATNHDVPDQGSTLNFTPRANFGATFGLSDNARLSASIGWFHISNAQTSGENPGIDALAIGLGLSFEF